MKITTFTDTMIKKLKPEDKKYVRGEGNGFTIRVMPSGAKTWLYVYALNDKRREMNLGSYPDVTLETARGKFEDAKKKVKNGIDPMAEKEQATHERLMAPTVEKFCEEYIKRHAKRFKKSWEKDERILQYDVIPAWGKRKAADIVKRDVVLLLEKIVERGAPGMANNTFQVIRKMFNWGVEQDILTTTPCIGVKLPAPKQSRERVLSEAEIKTFWTNLDSCAMSGEIRRALRLILLTAQRPGEVIGMHTNEIDGDWWTIPAERSKNGKANRVPLTPLVKEIIAEGIEEVKQAREIPAEGEYEGFIFPTPSKKKAQSIAGQALIVAVARNLDFPLVDAKGKPLFNKEGKPATVNNIGIDHFTPHDLRRTAATFMAESGEMDEVIDAILNHAKKGVIKVYNQYRYDREKRMALESWGRKLTSIISNEAMGKVVSIQGRKKAK